MQIKLQQTGGFIPLHKEASTEVSWTEQELQELVALIETRRDPASPVRDAQYFTLLVNDLTISIDITKVPKAYQHIFDDLRGKMKVLGM